MWVFALIVCTILLIYYVMRRIAHRTRTRSRNLLIRSAASTPTGMVPVIVVMYAHRDKWCSKTVHELFELAQNPYRVTVVVYQESDGAHGVSAHGVHRGRLLVYRHTCEAPAGLLHALADGLARVPAGAGVLMMCTAGLRAVPGWDSACVRSVTSSSTVASGLPGEHANFLCVQKKYYLPHVVPREFPFPPGAPVPMSCVSAALLVAPLGLGRAAVAAAAGRVPRGFPTYASDLILADELFKRGCSFYALVEPIASGTYGGPAAPGVKPASWSDVSRRMRISKDYACLIGVDTRLRRVSGRARMGLLPSQKHEIQKYGSTSRAKAFRELYV